MNTVWTSLPVQRARVWRAACVQVGRAVLETADSSQSLGKAEKVGQWLYKGKRGVRGHAEGEIIE